MVYTEEHCTYNPKVVLGSHIRYWAHLWADSEEELHIFAKLIGLRRGWFQPHELLPHYDVSENKRREAIANGAISINLKGFIKALRERDIGYRGDGS